MSLPRKFYFLGFAIFIFSYFLPAVRVFGQPLAGYEGALWISGALFEFDGIVNYAFIVFANLATLLTVMVFILQFKFSFRKLIVLQSMAFLSAAFWAAYDLVREQDLSDLYIGYWNWLFGIAMMLTAMFASMRSQKRIRVAPEDPS